MSSSYGENIRVTIFGQSHSPAIGVTIDGLPAGHRIDLDALRRFTARRAPGQNDWSTPRREADEAEIVSGLVNGVTCGAPLTALIRNSDTRARDYEQLRRIPRPGHADYTAQIKYAGAQDVAGGGHFSGRLTAPLCIAGGICVQLCRAEGIEIISRAAEIGGVADEGALCASTADKPFPAVSDECADRMRARIAEAKAAGDSVGGVVECAVINAPAGLGGPLFGGLESRIAAIAFGIPAVKGVEFGAGFGAARLRGSENNDPFVLRGGAIETRTNNCGGILGGISDGMPIVFRVAFKPTPSIAAAQDSVDMLCAQPARLEITGRHDPCIVPRAVPCVEAAAAIAVYDALLSRRKELG